MKIYGVEIPLMSARFITKGVSKYTQQNRRCRPFLGVCVRLCVCDSQTHAHTEKGRDLTVLMQTTRNSCSSRTKIIKSLFVCQKTPIFCFDDWKNSQTHARTKQRQNYATLIQTTRISCCPLTKTKKSLFICQKSPNFCWRLNTHTNYKNAHNNYIEPNLIFKTYI